MWLQWLVVDSVQQMLLLCLKQMKFPEDSLSSESEDDRLDLSDQDTGAYTTSESEDMKGDTNGVDGKDVGEKEASNDETPSKYQFQVWRTLQLLKLAIFYSLSLSQAAVSTPSPLIRISRWVRL